MKSHREVSWAPNIRDLDIPKPDDLQFEDYLIFELVLIDSRIVSAFACTQEPKNLELSAAIGKFFEDLPAEISAIIGVEVEITFNRKWRRYVASSKEEWANGGLANVLMEHGSCLPELWKLDFPWRPSWDHIAFALEHVLFNQNMLLHGPPPLQRCMGVYAFDGSGNPLMPKTEESTLAIPGTGW